MSHPDLVRIGLDPTNPGALSTAAVEREAAIAAAVADLPTTYETTTAHLHLTAPLDGGPNGVTPVDGSVNIVGKHSATKLSVVGFDSTNTQVMSATAFTWTQLAAVLEADGALLVELFDVLGFTNYSVTQSVADDLAAKRQAVADAQGISVFASEIASEMGGNGRFVWNQLGGFLETVQPRQLDLSILPTVVVTIHLSDTTAITTSKGDSVADFIAEGSNTGTFNISRPELFVTAIGFGNASYDQYVSAAMAKRAIELPFRNYRYFYRGDFEDVADFSATTRSLDRIHFQTSPSGYISGQPTPVEVPGFATEAVPGEKYASSFFMSSADGDASDIYLSEKFQLQVNGTPMPSCFIPRGLKRLTVAEWGGVNCHRVLRLNRPGSSVQSSSGLDTRNSIAESQVMHFAGDDPTAWKGAALHVWVEMTSVVRVLPNRDLEVVV